jgi:hypothetical protein
LSIAFYNFNAAGARPGGYVDNFRETAAFGAGGGSRTPTTFVTGT